MIMIILMDHLEITNHNSFESRSFLTRDDILKKYRNNFICWKICCKKYVNILFCSLVWIETIGL